MRNKLDFIIYTTHTHTHAFWVWCFVLFCFVWWSTFSSYSFCWVASMTATDSSLNGSLPAHGPILLWCHIYLCIHMYVFILAHGLNKENLNLNLNLCLADWRLRSVWLIVRLLAIKQAWNSEQKQWLWSNITWSHLLTNTNVIRVQW